MNSLLVALSTHQGDLARTESLLHWIKELGNVKDHSLLIAADAGIPQEKVKALLDIVRNEFNSVRAMIVQTGVVGWPLAANLMFRAVARQIHEGYKLPWLWLESDAVPLRATWLDEIAEAYQKCPRPLMGCVLDAERAIEGLPNRYLAGVSVYPQDTFGLLSDRWNDAKFVGMAKPPKLGVAQWQQNVRAFDMVFANDLVPRAHNTPLIQHFWGPDYATHPVFVTARTEADPPNALTLDFVRKDAAIFHRVKDVDGFLAMWRVRMNLKEALETIPQSVAELPTEAPSTPSPFGLPGADNPNWRGGADAEKERRKAAAQRSKDYIEESKRKAQQQAAAKQPESVTA